MQMGIHEIEIPSQAENSVWHLADDTIKADFRGNCAVLHLVKLRFFLRSTCMKRQKDKVVFASNHAAASFEAIYYINRDCVDGIFLKESSQ